MENFVCNFFFPFPDIYYKKISDKVTKSKVNQTAMHRQIRKPRWHRAHPSAAFLPQRPFVSKFLLLVSNWEFVCCLWRELCLETCKYLSSGLFWNGTKYQICPSFKNKCLMVVYHVEEKITWLSIGETTDLTEERRLEKRVHFSFCTRLREQQNLTFSDLK